MANVAVYNMEGKEVDKIELNDSIFGVEINEHLVHMAVLQQLQTHRIKRRDAEDIHIAVFRVEDIGGRHARPAAAPCRDAPSAAET